MNRHFRITLALVCLLAVELPTRPTCPTHPTCPTRAAETIPAHGHLLTTVSQLCRNIGTVALNALLEQIKNPGMEPREILIEVPIVVRQSTKCE